MAAIRDGRETPEHESDVRARRIMRTGAIGILANVLLAAFKATVGLLSHSIAIVLDAVNNLSDAASSLITIAGTRLAGKSPDHRHPFGHGRAEYLSAMIISVIVLYAGLTSLIESVKRILHPITPNYGVSSLLIVASAVAVKVLLGRYVKRMGEETHSDALVNSGQDAMLDAVISASTLAAAAVFLMTGLSVEAWLAAAISLIIIRSGVRMLQETISKIIGERPDEALVRAIRETVMSFPDVTGVYDLILNNYGPDAFNGSLHIEVPDTYTADRLDELIRQITLKVYREHRVVLVAVGIYARNTQDEKAVRIRREIEEVLMGTPYVMQVHGFYLNEASRTLRFDVIIGFDAPDRYALYDQLRRKICGMYPDYAVEMVMDTDFSESAGTAP